MDAPKRREGFEMCPNCGSVNFVVRQWEKTRAWIFCENCKYDGVIKIAETRYQDVKCPCCDRVVEGEILTHGSIPFSEYYAHCEHCDYYIQESEWEPTGDARNESKTSIISKARHDVAQ